MHTLKEKLAFPSGRVLAGLAIAILSCAVICLVILSPFALAELGKLKTDWSQLSNIGQTYGAVSALLSSLALGGVVVSLLFQARSNQTAREETTRTLHHDLIKMEMGDPKLMTAMGAPWGLPIPADAAAIRGFLYIRMWTTFLAGNLTIGEIAESEVRYLAAHEIFGSQAGRDFWAAVGRTTVERSAGRRHKFYQILDDEYGKIISEGVPVAEPIREVSPAESGLPRDVYDSKFIRHDQIKQLGIIAVAATAGVLAERTRRRCSS